MGSWALMGLITFLIEFAIEKRHKYLTVVSILLAIVTIVLSG